MSTIADRFVLKTRKGTGGCIIWIGTRPGGYGAIREGGEKGGKMLAASHVAYELFRGPIPAGLCVLHNCPDGDNPSCVNPFHLWLGTQLDNVADRNAKGRQTRGEKHPRARLTDAKVKEIRRRCAAGETQMSVARSLGIPGSLVCNIVARKLWAHL